MIRARAVVEATGGEIEFGRNHWGDLYMAVKTDAGDKTYITLSPQQWNDLCGFFSHPVLSESFEPYLEEGCANDDVPF